MSPQLGERDSVGGSLMDLTLILSREDYEIVDGNGKKRSNLQMYRLITLF